jgi:hypothetical protein
MANVLLAELARHMNFVVEGWRISSSRFHLLIDNRTLTSLANIEELCSAFVNH